MTREPAIAVGLVERAGSVAFRLLGGFFDARGTAFSPGEYTITCSRGTLNLEGGIAGGFAGLTLSPASAESAFRLQVTIGIDFHWQQKQEQTFRGSLRFLPADGDRLTVINDVPLETYILSVSRSEMSAKSPQEFLRAHSIISRSWLLAQLEQGRFPSERNTTRAGGEGEIIRWYDRQTHKDFDVCADDHCQRYQGIGDTDTGPVTAAVEATAGLILTYGGKPCDARFSKCCGGVTEDFRLAWGETARPYLVPVFDGRMGKLPDPPLSDEQAAREFIGGSPASYCNCADQNILGMVLNDYDRSTGDFFRWRVRLTPGDIAGFLGKKLGLDLGRIVALLPVERGLSGRIKRLRLIGEKAAIVIGKELEIRRALSPTHLYSSAFVVDTEGATERPDAFILRGAGWGHGVGLCQIGAAVMACEGIGYREILKHYYPGSEIERVY
jgi:peptidoglycan hydrolase-like amidase